MQCEKEKTKPQISSYFLDGIIHSLLHIKFNRSTIKEITMLPGGF